MNTAYYTFTTWNDSAMAAGFDGAAASRQSAMQRQPQPRSGGRPLGGDNVIDLAAWRAANAAELWRDSGEEDRPCGELETLDPELAIPAPRPRKSHRAGVRAELVSTVSVALAALAIILRVLAF